MRGRQGSILGMHMQDKPYRMGVSGTGQHAQGMQHRLGQAHPDHRRARAQGTWHAAQGDHLTDRVGYPTPTQPQVVRITYIMEHLAFARYDAACRLCLVVGH